MSVLRKAVLLAGLILAGVSSAPAQQAEDLKVAFARWTGHAPIMVGIEKGIYAKHGLNIKPLFYQSGVDMLQGQMGGQQDVSGFGTAPTLTAFAKGFDIVIFGMMSNLAANHNFEVSTVVARPEAGIAVGDIAKLKGKKIGLPLGTAAEQHLQGLLKLVNMTLGDVTTINMAPPNAVTAFKTGAVDVIIVWNPFATLAMEQVQGAVPVVVGAGPCKACYDPGFLLTSRKILNEKKALLEKFYVATAEAMKYTRQNINEAAEITSRWTEGTGLESLKKIIAFEAPSFDPRFSKNISKGFSEASIPFLLDRKQIDKAFDPSALLYPDFYEKYSKSNPELFSDLEPIPPAARLE